MKILATLLALGVLLAAATAKAQNWRAYAKREAAKVGWTGQEWRALDAIVTPESGWNPCRHFPQTTDCGYTGRN